VKSVRVVGAGMSGLLAAYYLVRAGMSVEVFERDADVGGKIKTVPGAHGLLETSANAIIADAEVEKIAKKIGVELISARKESRRRWILRRGKLRRWPLGFVASLRVLMFFVLKSLFPQLVHPKAFETLQTWGQRVLGLEATSVLLAPACQGIFGVDPSELSATLVYSYFFKPHEDREKGEMRGSVAPLKGMGDFPLNLKFFLQRHGVKFHFNVPSIAPDKEFDATVVATDVVSAKNILRKLGDPRAAILDKLPTVDLISVNVMYEKDLPRRKKGFGALFPPTELVEPLGVLFNSSIFNGRSKNAWSETWIFGGRNSWRRTRDTHNAFLTDIAQMRLKMHDRHDEPLEYRVNVWPQAIPLYGIELEKSMGGLKQGLDGVYLMGNYLGEIGLNRLFHRAKDLAKEVYSG